jgi:hypothetical protein
LDLVFWAAVVSLAIAICYLLWESLVTIGTIRAPIHMQRGCNTGPPAGGG